MEQVTQEKGITQGWDGQDTRITEDRLRGCLHTRAVVGLSPSVSVSQGHLYCWMSGILKTIVSCILSAVKIYIVTSDFVIVHIFFGCSRQEDTSDSQYFTVARSASLSSDADSHLFKLTENCFGLTSGLSREDTTWT